MKKKTKLSETTEFLIPVFSMGFAFMLIAALVHPLSMSFNTLTEQLLNGLLIISAWLWLASFLTSVALIVEYKLKEYTGD